MDRIAVMKQKLESSMRKAEDEDDGILLFFDTEFSSRTVLNVQTIIILIYYNLPHAI